MTPAVLLTMMMPVLGPHTATAISRAVTAAADADGRFDVVSAWDLREVDALERCIDDGTTAAAACVDRIATAASAELIFFARVYELGGETQVALTLAERAGVVVARRAFAGNDERALFARAAVESRAVLAAYNPPAALRPRIFVPEPAVQSTALRKAELDERIRVVEADVLAEELWTGIGAGVLFASFVPIYTVFYADRFDALPDGPERALVFVGGAAAFVALFAPTYALWVLPGSERLQATKNRRDALVSERVGIDEEEE